MSIEEKKELMQSMAEMMKGAKVEQMIMFAESGSKIVYKEVEPETKQEVKVEDLIESADKVRPYNLHILKHFLHILKVIPTYQHLYFLI